MDIIQKNILGNNVVYYVSPDFVRELPGEVKEEVIAVLKSLDVTSVSIRYEHGAETAQFSNLVSQFLQENEFIVYVNSFLMSEIQRNEFSIQRHPSDPNFAMIKIGTVL